jgi:hypothetical protein
VRVGVVPGRRVKEVNVPHTRQGQRSSALRSSLRT